MITREQVADLRPGDVVELRFQAGTVIRGPLAESRLIGGLLGIAGAGWDVRCADGSPAPHFRNGANTLTVVSRAPRPLYVNSDRTEPVPGDVVRDADSDERMTWAYADADDDGDEWAINDRTDARYPTWCGREDLPDRLRLLVDGTTGQAVTS